MEHIHREPDWEALHYGSVVDYLFEDDGEHLVYRSGKLIDTIDELLVFDDDGTPKGILDGTYLNDRDVRQLAGKTYVQTEDLRHMNFILNSSAADTIALDELELSGGDTVGDRLDQTNFAEEIAKFNDETEEDFVARRAYLIRSACEILLEEHGEAESSSA